MRRRVSLCSFLYEFQQTHDGDADGDELPCWWGKKKKTEQQNASRAPNFPKSLFFLSLPLSLDYRNPLRDNFLQVYSVALDM